MSSRYITSSTARGVAGTGLVVAAVGIPIQVAGGADYPTVPTGLLISPAAAAVREAFGGRAANMHPDRQAV